MQRKTSDREKEITERLSSEDLLAFSRSDAFRWQRQKADTRHRESASLLRHHGKKETIPFVRSSLTCSMSHSLKHAVFKQAPKYRILSISV